MDGGGLLAIAVTLGGATLGESWSQSGPAGRAHNDDGRMEDVMEWVNW